MDSIYGNSQFCMEFSNADIIKYLVEPVEKNSGTIVKISTDREDDVSRTTMDKIRGIDFDDDKGNISVLFCDHLTALFVLNKEFMIFDDNIKAYQTSSETYGNIVYEGETRNKTHRKLLKIVYELYMIVKDAKAMKIEETVIKQQGFQYPQCEYIVRVRTDSNKRQVIQFENIQFIFTRC